MTKFPEKTRCSHGGFGQKRLDKCDATKSKSGKHRNFHDSCEFIKGCVACSTREPSETETGRPRRTGT
jgi:hypothetical protein